MRCQITHVVMLVVGLISLASSADARWTNPTILNLYFPGVCYDHEVFKVGVYSFDTGKISPTITISPGDCVQVLSPLFGLYHACCVNETSQRCVHVKKKGPESSQSCGKVFNLTTSGKAASKALEP